MSGKIVVGYDGGDASEHALGRAIEEARDAGRHLVVVAVLEMPLNPEGPQNFGTLDDSPARMIPLVQPPELEPVLAHARARVEAEALRGTDYVWAVGEPADAIMTAAKDHRASLIVVGSHHHGFLKRLLGSDVAAAVKREAECEVLVVE